MKTAKEVYVEGVGIKECGEWWGRQTVEHELCRGERRVDRERSAETRNGAHAMDIRCAFLL